MGVAGWVHYLRDLRDEHVTVARMAAAGGPVAAEGVKLSRQAGFVIDEGAAYAAQMRPERLDLGIAVAVDGRIANRGRMLAELEQPPDIDDATLILHAYRRWGTAIAYRLDGAFAIMVWDRGQRRLQLICDPIGRYGWFYHRLDHGVLFGTRVRSVLAHPAAPRQLAADGLNELLSLGATRTPGHGIARDVHEVLPGHWLEATPGRVQHHAYWEWRPERHEHGAVATAALVRRLLSDATIGLRREPPEALLLSGGSASAALAALTGSAGRPTAYTMTAAQPSTPAASGSNLGVAARIAQHLGLRHHSLAVASKDLSVAGDLLTSVLDFPGEAARDAACFALLRRVADEGVTSVVSGTGAAGVFGSYPWLHRPPPAAADTFPWLEPPWVTDRLLSTEARHLLRPDTYRQRSWHEALRGVPASGPELGVIRQQWQMRYLALTRYLPAHLRRVWQLATVAGLRLDTPLADFVLAQYVINVPAGLRRQADGERFDLLQHATADLLPQRSGRPSNAACSSPDLLSEWRPHQHERLRHLIADPAQPLQPLLDQSRIKQLLDLPVQHLPAGWWALAAHLLDANAWLARHRMTLP